MPLAAALARFASFAAFRVDCGGGPAGFAGDERSAGFQVVLPRRGAFRWRRRAGDFEGDPLAAQWLDDGEEYRVAHPDGGGDRCFVLSFTPSAARSLACAERFPFAATAVPRASEVESLRLERALRLDQLAPLEAEEAAVSLAAGLLAAEVRRRRAASRDPSCGADRAKLARRARELLRVRYREALPLERLAAEVGASPWHLCRAFAEAAGETLHAFQDRLRMGEAVARLEDGERDLLRLALDLGYFDHSHFTSAFRRAFGCPPSAWRQANRPSKDLQAAARRRP